MCGELRDAWESERADCGRQRQIVVSRKDEMIDDANVPWWRRIFPRKLAEWKEPPMFHERWLVVARSEWRWRPFFMLTFVAMLGLSIAWSLNRLNPRATPPSPGIFLMMLVPASVILVGFPIWLGRRLARRWSLFAKCIVCVHAHTAQVSFVNLRSFAWGWAVSHVFLVLRPKNERHAAQIVGLPLDADRTVVAKTLLAAGVSEEALERCDDGWKPYL